MTQLADIYLEDIRTRFTKLQATAEGAIAQVTAQQFGDVPDPDGNSIAIIAKHVGGNLRSRFTDFLTTDGEKPDRHRDEEFEAGGQDTEESVMARWSEGWNTLYHAIDQLKPDDLVRTVTIRGEPHSVVGALNRSLSHIAYHTGQIVTLARHFAGTSWKPLSIPRRAATES